MVIYTLLACLACKWLQIGTAMLLIITSTNEELLTNVNVNNLIFFEYWFNVIFLAIFGCKKVNYEEMDGDRLRLPANTNCYRLSRASWVLLKFLVRMLNVWFFGGAYVPFWIIAHCPYQNKPIFKTPHLMQRSSIYLLSKPISNLLCPKLCCHGNEGRLGKNSRGIIRWPIPENLPMDAKSL